MIERTLSYGKKPIRVLVSSEGAWFAAADIYAAHQRYTDRSFLAHFAPEHLKLATFPNGEGTIRLTAVSPLGVATIATSVGPPRDRMLDGWVRREANKLASEFGFAPLNLSLVADGCLPAKPLVSHDRYADWCALKEDNPGAHRRQANLEEPALFDQDPKIRPHDPAGDRERSRALLEALSTEGKRIMAADAKGLSEGAKYAQND